MKKLLIVILGVIGLIFLSLFLINSYYNPTHIKTSQKVMIELNSLYNQVGNNAEFFGYAELENKTISKFNYVGYKTLKGNKIFIKYITN